MKRTGTLFVFAAGLLGLALLSSCTKNLSQLPISPSSPSQTNLLSAYATIGASAAFDMPYGIQYVNNHLWVANWSTCLQEWPTSGLAPVTTIWTYDSGVSFTELNGDSIDPATGNVYACDETNEQVVVFNSTGNYVTLFGSAQLAGPTPVYPIGVAVNSAGTTVYVLGLETSLVYVYGIGGTPSSPSYTYQFSFGQSGPSSTTLHSPYNLRVDGQGDIWVADTQNNRIAEYNAMGGYIRSFGDAYLPKAFLPEDVLVDSSGNVYAVSSTNDRVVKFNSLGSVLGQFGVGVLNSPTGIATDGAGTFYVTNDSPQQIVAFH